MIVFWLLYPILALMDALVSALPAATLPAAVSSAITDVAGYANALSNFLPVSTFLTILLLDLTFEVGVLLYKAARWLWKATRGSG